MLEEEKGERGKPQETIFLEVFEFYPMTTSSNTPIFLKVGEKSCYVPG